MLAPEVLRLVHRNDIADAGRPWNRGDSWGDEIIERERESTIMLSRPKRSSECSGVGSGGERGSAQGFISPDF